MNTRTVALTALSFLFFTLLPGVVLAKGPELKFTSLVSGVVQTDVDSGTVAISIQALDLPIVVNDDTEVEFQGEEVGIGEISAGDLVKIRAFFSDEGITADEIEILETRFQQFKLSGVISQIEGVAENTFITVSGVEVIANASTNVVSRNAANSQLALSSLQEGEVVSINGYLQEGQLIARQIFVGQREHGEIEFEGTLVSVGSSSIMVEVIGGVVVTVLFEDSTRIEGLLSNGAFVEVEGRFNSNLDIVASEVDVDSDGDNDADDDNSQGDDDSDAQEVGNEISLRPVNSSLTGKAEIELSEEVSRVEQEFEVEVEDSAAGVTYSILVYFGETSVDFGTITTNQFGEAEAEYEVDDSISDRELAPLLPAGLTVLDITRVEVLLQGEVVLEGEFDNSVIGGASIDDNNVDDSLGNDDNGGDDDNSNDGNEDGVEVEREAGLIPNNSTVNGDADVRYRGALDQKFQMEIDDAPAGSTLTILVLFGADSVDFGTVVVDSLGEADVEYEIDDDISDRPLAPYLPAGSTVLDITGVQILLSGDIVAQGSF